MSGYVHAKNPEEACTFAVADSTDAIKKDLILFAGKTYKVEANYLGSYDHYDFFRFTIRLAENGEVAMTPLMVLQPQAEEYVLCLLSSVLQTIENHCKCTTCQGSGQVYTGGNTCAICAGTGQQYYPNVYYDAALQMWQGLYQVCSGCAGAGHTGGILLTCDICRGIGLILD